MGGGGHQAGVTGLGAACLPGKPRTAADPDGRSDQEADRGRCQTGALSLTPSKATRGVQRGQP